MADDFTAIEKQFGSVFGSWHIVRIIGRGSYGTVYEVQKESGGLVDKAAIKHVSFPLDQQDLRRICEEVGTTNEAVIRDYVFQSVKEYRGEYEFMRELKGQTHIVSCEDFQVLEKADMPGYDIFIRMELLETVANRAMAGRMTQDEVVRMGIDICQALELIAKKNIIHRDIKPENIFVNENGDYKLGDFGSARSLGGLKSVVTAKGTPAYMAPEIMQMKEAGTYTDIYSLGLVMYRYTNGNRLPFMESLASTTMRRDEAASKRISGEKIPAPADADPALARIILKACEYKPEDRYQQAAELREALERFQRGETEEPPKPVKGILGRTSSVRPTVISAEKVAKDRGALHSIGSEGTRKTVLTPEEIAAIEAMEKKREEERKLQELLKKQKEEEERKARNKKILIGSICGVAAAIILLVGGILIHRSEEKKRAYSAGIELLEAGNYDEAQKALEGFEDGYQDAKERKEELSKKIKERDTNFGRAEYLRKNGSTVENFNEAVNLYKQVQPYYPEETRKEIDQYIEESQKSGKLREAENLMQAGDYDGAAGIYNALGETQLEKEAGLEKKYQDALVLINEGTAESYEAAVNDLNELQTEKYRETIVAELQEEVQMRAAFKKVLGIYDQKQYATAGDLFGQMEGFEFEDNTGSYSAADMAALSGKWDIYTRARKAYGENDFEGALELFRKIPGHEDANSMVSTIQKDIENRDRFDEAIGKMKEAEPFYKSNNKDNLSTAISRFTDAKNTFDSLPAGYTYPGEGTSASEKAKECEQWINFLTGRIYLLDKRYDEAQPVFEALDDSFAGGEALERKAEAKRGDADTRAQAEIISGNYDAAEKIYDELGEDANQAEAVKAGKEKIQEWRDYDAAVGLLQAAVENDEYDEEMFDQAIQAFSALQNFVRTGTEDRSARAMVTEAMNAKEYRRAEALEARDDYGSALEIYQKLGDYGDSAEKAMNAQGRLSDRDSYDMAVKKLEEGIKDIHIVRSQVWGQRIETISSAKETFDVLGNRGYVHTDGTRAAQRSKECQNWIDYLEARIYLSQSEPDYVNALLLLEPLDTGFADGQAGYYCAQAMEKDAEIRAEAEMAKGDFEAAGKIYAELSEKLPNVAEEGNAEVLNRQKYTEGIQLLEKAQQAEEYSEADYEQAIAIFDELGTYNGKGQVTSGKEMAATARKSRDYRVGLNYEAAGDYEGAQNTFSSLGNYEDARDRLKVVRTIREARTTMDTDRDYEGALRQLNAISAYNRPEEATIQQMQKECSQHIDYSNALREVQNGDFESAGRRLRKLSEEGYSDADVLIGHINTYNEAQSLMNISNYQAAHDKFASLPEGIYIAAQRARECQNELDYAQAKNIMKENPREAAKIFERLGSLHDSPSSLATCNKMIQYTDAVAMMNAGNPDGALALLRDLNSNGGYENSVQLANECNQIINYRTAKTYMNQGNSYKEAYNLFVSLGEYNDSKALAHECDFELFCSEVASGGATYKMTKRAYRYIFEQKDLDRNNKVQWAREIEVNDVTGASLATSFAMAPRFANSNLTNRQRVGVLFAVLMNREINYNSDYKATLEKEPYQGSENSVEYLNVGMTVNAVLWNIIHTPEFANICRDDGLGIGDIPLEETRDRNYQVTRFIVKSYRAALNRNASGYELNLFTDYYLNQNMSMEQILMEFLTSQEMQNRYLNDPDYVTMLFRLMFDREPGADEQANRVRELTEGKERLDLAEELIRSVECAEYLDQFRLTKAEREKYGGSRLGKYNEALKAMEEGRYSDALAGFNQMQDYLNSAEKADECGTALFSRDISGGNQVNNCVLRTYKEIYHMTWLSEGDRKAWAQQIPNSTVMSDIVEAYVYTDAFRNGKISNKERVASLFRIMLGRGPSDDAYLIETLDKGFSGAYVASQLLVSPECMNLCAREGLEQGSITLKEARDKDQNLTWLVRRCYQFALNREPGAGEYNMWCELYLNGSTDGAGLIQMIICGPEASAYLQDDEAFYDTLFELSTQLKIYPAVLEQLRAERYNGKSREEIAGIVTSMDECRIFLDRNGIR